ncbi:MAG: YceI family protein [Coxiellaceae bacterium]|nr:MAG: YceI family protein [Coxiellaceae bacterium]
MNRVIAKLWWLVIGFSLLPISALAANWQLVPDQSSITFTATQNNAPIIGKFTRFSGDINFDPKQLNTSHAKITVDMNSVSASYEVVADTLKTPDWFDVKQFPQAIFEANNFSKTADNQYQANGTLTLRDKTLPVTLTFSQENTSDTQYKIKGSTSIQRTNFGVGRGEWSKTNEVKDQVQINFIVTMIKK